MRTILLIACVALSGCTTIKQLWPRPHDPVLADRWVSVNIELAKVDCSKSPTGWGAVVEPADHLQQLAAFRSDPQSENLLGLYKHTVRMSQGGSKMFCEIGIKTAQARLNVARSAWEGR